MTAVASKKTFSLNKKESDNGKVKTFVGGIWMDREWIKRRMSGVCISSAQTLESSRMA